MKNYSTAISGPTPQTRPLFNHPEMVQNNAGGYVLLGNMPLTALLRNLNRFASAGSIPASATKCRWSI